MRTELEMAMASILEKIKNAKSNTVEIRDFEFGSGKLYCREEYYPQICKDIMTELKKLGYKIRIKCTEKQFVDMWLEIDTCVTTKL